MVGWKDKQKQMEETNKPIEEKELEAPDMDNNLRSDDHIDIGDEQAEQPTPPTLLKGSEEFSFKNGQYEINISSSVLRSDYLMQLCLGFLEEFKKDKPNKSGGSYLG